MTTKLHTWRYRVISFSKVNMEQIQFFKENEKRTDWPRSRTERTMNAKNLKKESQVTKDCLSHGY